MRSKKNKSSKIQEKTNLKAKNKYKREQRKLLTKELTGNACNRCLQKRPSNLYEFYYGLGKKYVSGGYETTIYQLLGKGGSYICDMCARKNYILKKFFNPLFYMLIASIPIWLIYFFEKQLEGNILFLFTLPAGLYLFIHTLGLILKNIKKDNQALTELLVWSLRKKSIKNNYTVPSGAQLKGWDCTTAKNLFKKNSEKFSF